MKITITVDEEGFCMMVDPPQPNMTQLLGAISQAKMLAEREFEKSVAARMKPIEKSARKSK